jgi:ribosomal protein L37E
MGVKIEGPDIFTLKSGYVECISGSGHTYKITHDSCSCKGFGFRRLCRHYTQAKQKGLLDNLEVQITKEIKLTQSGHMKKLRMDAIRQYLEKMNIRYKPSNVIDIEKILTTKTTPKDIMGFFF